MYELRIVLTLGALVFISISLFRNSRALLIASGLLLYLWWLVLWIPSSSYIPSNHLAIIGTLATALTLGLMLTLMPSFRDRVELRLFIRKWLIASYLLFLVLFILTILIQIISTKQYLPNYVEVCLETLLYDPHLSGDLQRFLGCLHDMFFEDVSYSVWDSIDSIMPFVILAGVPLVMITLAFESYRFFSSRYGIFESYSLVIKELNQCSSYLKRKIEEHKVAIRFTRHSSPVVCQKIGSGNTAAILILPQAFSWIIGKAVSGLEEVGNDYLAQVSILRSFIVAHELEHLASKDTLLSTIYLPLLFGTKRYFEIMLAFVGLGLFWTLSLSIVEILFRKTETGEVWQHLGRELGWLDWHQGGWLFSLLPILALYGTGVLLLAWHHRMQEYKADSLAMIKVIRQENLTSSRAERLIAGFGRYLKIANEVSQESRLSMLSKLENNLPRWLRTNRLITWVCILLGVLRRQLSPHPPAQLRMHALQKLISNSLFDHNSSEFGSE